MRIQNNLKRISRFFVNRRREFFTREFWNTVMRLSRERFNFYDKVSRAEFLYNLEQIENRPWNLHIELTNICNANCVFCPYSRQTRKPIVMEGKIYSKALGDYCAIGGGELRLETCVGDPLMDPNFIERAKEARAHPEIKEIITLTNGINIDSVGIEKLLYSGISQINISTGPWTDSLYASIYRNKNYQRLRKNVTGLLEMNSRLKKPLRIRLLFRSNLSMKETLSLSDYKAIRFLPHEIEFNADFDTWAGLIKQEDLCIGMHIRPQAEFENEPCYALYDGPIIFSDGSVGLCSCRDFNADSELVIGNIAEASLLELWRSEKAGRLRQQFWDKQFPCICRSCTAYANLDIYRSRRGSLRAKIVKEQIQPKELKNAR